MSQRSAPVAPVDVVIQGVGGSGEASRPSLGADFDSASTVSTGRSCDGCDQHIHAIRWWQCAACKEFDLCPTCAKPTDKRDKRECDKKCSNSLCEDPKDLTPLTYAQSQEKVHRDALKQGWKNRLDQLVDGDKEEISGSRDVFLLERALSKKSDKITEINSLLQLPAGSTEPKELEDLIRLKKMSDKLLAYINIESTKTPVKILSLDGGGVRGLLSIRVLRHMMNKLFDGPAGDEIQKQQQFVRQFQYIAGTSTGGLIGFCLAVDVPLAKVEEIYLDAKKYFKPSSGKKSTWKGWAADKALSWLTWSNPEESFHVDRAKYDPTPIHEKINEFVTIAFAHLAAPPVDPTIADLDRLLNPKGLDGQLINPTPRALVINTFEAATGKVRMIDSSNLESADFLLKDVLKGTMAAPLFFPAHTSNTFLDGGLFANDPMLAALHCARRNHRVATDFSQYRLVGLGTGISLESLEDIDKSPPHGGLSTWMLGEKKGLLVDTVLEANRSFTETISEGLAHFQRIRRFKFNLIMKKEAALDDFRFVEKLGGGKQGDTNWLKIQASDDMQALEQFLRHQLK